MCVGSLFFHHLLCLKSVSSIVDGNYNWHIYKRQLLPSRSEVSLVVCFFACGVIILSLSFVLDAYSISSIPSVEHIGILSLQ